MPIRKSDDIENESDDRYENVRDANSRAKITRRFDAATHNPYPGDEALQYLNRKLDDVIDSANTNDAKTGITSGQASAITANTAKVSMVIGSGASQAMAGNTTSIATAVQTGNVTIGGDAIEGTLTFNVSEGYLHISDGENIFSIRAG